MVQVRLIEYNIDEPCIYKNLYSGLGQFNRKIRRVFGYFRFCLKFERFDETLIRILFCVVEQKHLYFNKKRKLTIESTCQTGLENGSRRVLNN